MKESPSPINLSDCLRGQEPAHWSPAYQHICADLASFTSPETAVVAEGDAMPVEPPERDIALAEDDAEPVCAATLPPIAPRVRGKTSQVIVVPHGCAVPSPADGRIRYAGFFKGYLGVVILETGSETRLTIAGLGEIAVQRGDSITRGATIGATSQSTAPALASAETAGEAALLYVEDASGADPSG
ncbi:M23 family metallopeptidase [Parvibaculum sp.]|uniref:peptidoglycan DD-metalloendopeptidase family protein n=1 Tax=Parvibaculum sp. TaxID=2024848 RepID=UPI001D645112|nr:M23 family metallopeptidase [Parvibaculum sp.]MBX3489539.1 M23 family metallopeptidase [Parvibaculum sp.]